MFFLKNELTRFFFSLLGGKLRIRDDGRSSHAGHRRHHCPPSCPRPNCCSSLGTGIVASLGESRQQIQMSRNLDLGHRRMRSTTEMKAVDRQSPVLFYTKETFRNYKTLFQLTNHSADAFSNFFLKKFPKQTSAVYTSPSSILPLPAIYARVCTSTYTPSFVYIYNVLSSASLLRRNYTQLVICRICLFTYTPRSRCSCSIFFPSPSPTRFRTPRYMHAYVYLHKHPHLDVHFPFSSLSLLRRNHTQLGMCTHMSIYTHTRM